MFRFPLPTLPEQHRISAILRQAEELRRVTQSTILTVARLRRELYNETFGRVRSTTTMISLGQITKFVTSGSRDWSRYYSNSNKDPKFLRVQNIKGGTLDFSEVAYVTPPHDSEADRARIYPSDILISITGTIGQAAMAPSDIGECYVSQHVALVRTDGSIPMKFLVEYINHPEGGQQQLLRSNYGQTKPGLNLKQIQDLRIPVFDSKLISQFVSKIEKVEELTRLLDESKYRLDQLLQQALAEAFSGELTTIWREAHRRELEDAARIRDKALKSAKVIVREYAPEERPWQFQEERNWIKNQLSELQQNVCTAMQEWRATLIPSEDMAEFKQSWPIEHLENADDQILRTLNQLAGLGLIVKIAVPNSEGEYMTAFRGIRKEEFSRSEDIEALSKTKG